MLHAYLNYISRSGLDIVQVVVCTYSLKDRSKIAFHQPAGEQRDGNSAIVCNVLDNSWHVLSGNDVCLPVERTLVGDSDGFNVGMCRTRTHRQTSRVAKTSDLPGTISPISLPSPITADIPVGLSLPLVSFSATQIILFLASAWADGQRAANMSGCTIFKRKA